jgi:hypothetical protein
MVGVASLAVVAGCSSDTGPDPEPVHNAGLSDPGDAGTPKTPSEPTPAAVTTGPVRVSTMLRVPASGATRALTAYVEAHARSVITGGARPALRAVTSDAEYRRQLRVIAQARDQGLTVPRRPRLAVVAVRSTASRVDADVCLWLPSTEYLDPATGVSPAGPVPQEWLPAVAHIIRAPTTWIVDKLSTPETEFAPDCGGLS